MEIIWGWRKLCKSDVNGWNFAPNILCLIKSEDGEMGKGGLGCVDGRVRNGYAILLRKSRLCGRNIDAYLKYL